jgi:hypothetical protein
MILQGKKPSDNQLIHYLKRKGVIHGVNVSRLSSIMSEKRFDEYIDVAFATPPVDGKDAHIEIKINISPELKPQMRNNGSVDYRNIQTFTSISKGELLAEKIPPVPGIPGKTVSGDPIEPQPGKDVNLPNGHNTEISEDGSKLFAAATGIVFYENGLLTIGELLHISKDVDFSVGNIKYTGDVLVDGSVKPGFKIEADGSIEVKGEVESAIITSRAGHVIVDKGVVGKSDTVISGKKGVTLSFAQDATILTEGTVTFYKYLLHCEVRCATLEGEGAQKA